MDLTMFWIWQIDLILYKFTVYILFVIPDNYPKVRQSSKEIVDTFELRGAYTIQE